MGDIPEKSEDVTPQLGGTTDKKKKKKKPTENSQEEEKKVLGEVAVNGENTEITDKENVITCAVCNKENPSKRCSKMHKKCMKLMFCNATCETLAHKKEDDKAALVKKEANKVAAAKKKAQGVKNWKNTDSGQFWWHDQ